MTKQKQRRLILIRHAKAVEDDPAGDHARPLAARGRQDAEALGRWLKDQRLTPDQVLCSTAQRTRETLELLNTGVTPDFRDRLYLAELGELLDNIHNTDDSISNLMIIGHNPGMHGILAMLTGDCNSREDEHRVAMKFPTASCAVLRFEADDWARISRHGGTLEQLRWSVDG